MADCPQTVQNVSKQPLSAERMAKLALAREKALEVRRKNMQKNLQARLDKVTEDLNPSPAPEPELKVTQEPSFSEPPVTDENVPPPVPEDDEPTPKPVKKKKKAPTIVVEQDSDDSDDYESNDRVIFVKRSKSKKQQKVTPPDPPPPSPPKPPPEPPPPPPQPQLTPEQMQIRSMYNNMYSGNFLHNPYQGRRARF